MATNNATNTSNPITVAQGGTGVATTTAYTVQCGGTTTTAPLQSIASVGTSGQVLTSNGAGALPTFQGSVNGAGWVKIQTQSASTSASLTFTTGITSTYENYVVVFDNVSVDSNGSLELQLSSDGGSTYATTGYQGGQNNFGFNSTTLTNTNITSGLYLGITNTAFITAGTIFLFNVTTGGYVMSSGTGVAVQHGTNTLMNLCVGNYATTITTNAMKILNTAGNMVTGTFTLYGIIK